MTKQEIKDAIRNNIISLRKNRGFSQQTFADKVGIGRSRLGAIEEGRCITSLDLLFKISEVFDIDFTELLSLDLKNTGGSHIALVINELNRAERKRSWKGNSIIKNALILAEESGEVCRAVLQYDEEGGSIGAVRTELIQTAAMCFRMLKNLPE